MNHAELALIDPHASTQSQAAAMAHACETTGFFAIPLASVQRDISDAAWNSAAEFFALPEPQKRRIEFPEAGYPYGYSPFQFETLAKSLDDGTPSGPDLKESLSVGPDCAVAQPDRSHSDDEAWIRSPSLWPVGVPHLQPAWEAYYQALADVAARLMRIMAVALSLPENHFDSLIDNPITSMRALNYPALDTLNASPTSLRAGAHSDYGTLTILRTGDIPGLEIRQGVGDSARWIPIAPQPDRFVVNLGDSIAQWTNDRWQSTMHRVALTDTAARQSFAFFHMANWDATIECLPSCRVEGQPPRHEPVQAGPWLMRKFQATVL